MAPSSRSRCGSSRLNPLFKFRQGALRDILRWDGGDEGEDYGRSASLLYVHVLPFDVEMLGTQPGYHGRGLASRLLRWGLERADEVGLETYLSSSPAGRPLYEKYGFRVVEEREVGGGYVQGYMLRAAR
ncbi:hypothetical protein CNMCM6106_005183 [Aspergillus hiratsukae]|uniref:N-acetyltransferase domain-containing protein n=1 Tax=Aspergillus hiratsukae TaxID=1194566 RepID=A0A8H6V048_9EURO|nr:hypothetical protein CNMCM6106_005183 [Aspergillus hiratsukae]